MSLLFQKSRLPRCIEDELPRRPAIPYPRKAERKSFMMCVEEEDEGIVRDGLAPRIAHVHRLSAKQEADRARVARTPFVIIHFLPGRIKPHDILDSQAANRSALEEFGSPKDRMLFAEADELRDERGLAPPASHCAPTGTS